MKLKLKEIGSLAAALIGIESTDDGSGKTKLCKFSAKFTWNKTKAIGLLQRKEKEIEKARVDLVSQYSGSTAKPVPEEKRVEFTEKWNAMMEEEEDFENLLTLPAKDLNLFDPKDNPTGNVIPSSFLAVLEPLLNMEGVEV